MYHGIINIYKEAGFTSHDVVAKLRGIFGQKKIGHTGTLDPDAIGVLPVCLGAGTKLCDMLTDTDKEYVATLRLGIETDTQDMSGKVLTEREVNVSKEQAVAAINSFLGAYEQIPPMYSALKVNGRKLYELARQGKEIERKARTVRIEEIEILQIELPCIRIRVVCSKGTYIRTLCEDIGKKLDCGAAMQSLERTRVGRFTVEDALTLAQVEDLQSRNRIAESIIPVEDMFSDLPDAWVKKEYGKLLANGNCLAAGMVNVKDICGDKSRFRMFGAQGVFYGIYQYDRKKEQFSPVKMFHAGGMEDI